MSMGVSGGLSPEDVERQSKLLGVLPSKGQQGRVRGNVRTRRTRGLPAPQNNRTHPEEGLRRVEHPAPRFSWSRVTRSGMTTDTDFVLTPILCDTDFVRTGSGF